MLTALIFLTLITTTFGHALWIVTDPNPTLGNPHPAKIYYDEYNQNEFEKTDKWYADVNKFALLWRAHACVARSDHWDEYSRSLTRCSQTVLPF